MLATTEQKDTFATRRNLVLFLASLAAILFLSLFRLLPPAPKPLDASPEDFSAERAKVILRDIAQPGTSRFTGSAGNAAARERLLKEFRRLGLETQVQEIEICRGTACPALVARNVIARLPGREGTQAVLLLAHYDSVPASPGGSDDGAGVVTVLETARALSLDALHRNPVIFLLTDGEEFGLHGARGFVKEHPWAADVRVAINVDNRGSSGPSMLFETSENNLWLIRLYAKHVRRPVTSSLFPAIFRTLPYGTDFTPIVQNGIHGLNFAYLGRVAHYHNSLDTAENADPRSIQHHGDNTLALARALADTDLETAPEKGDAVFFDVFSLFTVWYPASWTIVFLWLGITLLAATMGLLFWQKKLRPLPLFWGFTAFLFNLLLSVFFAGILMMVLVKMDIFPVKWIAYPLPAQVAFWILPFAVAGYGAIRSTPRTSSWAMWCMAWTGGAGLALVLPASFPAADYLLAIPLLAAGFLGLLAAAAGEKCSWLTTVAILLPPAVAATLWLPVMMFLYDALGFTIFPVSSLLIALIISSAAPVLAARLGTRRYLFPLVALAVVVLCSLTAVLLPAFTENLPEGINLVYVQDEIEKKAFWLVSPSSGALPETIQQAAPFGKERTRMFASIISGRYFTAEVPSLELPPPELSTLEVREVGGEIHWKARIQSIRGTSSFALRFSQNRPKSLRFRIGNSSKEQKFSSPRQLRIAGAPPEGLVLDMVFENRKPASLHIADISNDLPPGASALLQARPATAIPYQRGDQTVVITRVSSVLAWLDK